MTVTILHTIAAIYEILWFIFCFNLHLHILAIFCPKNFNGIYEKYPRADIYFKKNKIG